MSVSFSLCAPDDTKSCFACCPPIRPPGYEHIQYRTAVQRTLRENTRDFWKKGDGSSPITGFSCWALGYLDDTYRRIGCLLHPGRNEGVDLRDRTGFGDKCRRESCIEGKVFEKLSPPDRLYWLRLADGLDSFSYSSRAMNPLFRLLGWGEALLSAVASDEAGHGLTRESFEDHYPVLATDLNPRAHAYLLERVVSRRGARCLRDKELPGRFECLADGLKADLGEKAAHSDGSPPTHLLGLERPFLDYLRLSLGLKRVKEAQAVALKSRVDRAVDAFCGDRGPGG